MSNVGRTPILIDGRIGFLADTGCSVSPSCFSCPLARCKYDDLKVYAWLRF